MLEWISFLGICLPAGNLWQGWDINLGFPPLRLTFKWGHCMSSKTNCLILLSKDQKAPMGILWSSILRQSMTSITSFTLEGILVMDLGVWNCLCLLFATLVDWNAIYFLHSKMPLMGRNVMFLKSRNSSLARPLGYQNAPVLFPGTWECMKK